MNCQQKLPARTRLRRRPRERRGALLVLIAMLMAAFFITVIFSVDVAYMHLINAQLRAATDASAKAAVEVLARTEDVAAAREAAKNLAALNMVGGKPLTLEDGDIEFGSSDTSRADGKIGFVSGGSPLSAARITGRKLDGAASG
ncbi:MAG: hypothetical protein KDA92_01130, partial [Planctomycetales bacterium]|nr:hypothetical protein [Planctomycetales bacterium]